MISNVGRSAEVRLATRMLVEKWLGGWGAVEKERLLTGDPSAIPRGSYEVAGGRRGSPSDPSSLLEVWADVETTLGKGRPALRKALLHKYRDGLIEEGGVVRLAYNFGGADFRAFFLVEQWGDIERGLRGCGRSPRWMFERLVQDFESELARERGLIRIAEKSLPLEA